MLNSNHNGKLFDAEQQRWLNRQLTDPSVKNSCWQIVALHHPPFSSATVHGDNEHLQQTLVPLLHRHKVDLVLSGHSHCYERFDFGTDQQSEPVYIVSGGGGAYLHQFDLTDQRPRARFLEYNFLEISGDRLSLSLKARNEAGELIDQCQLTKTTSE